MLGEEVEGAGVGVGRVAGPGFVGGVLGGGLKLGPEAICMHVVRTLQG